MKPRLHLVISRREYPEEYYVARAIIRRKRPGAFTEHEYPRITWCGDWFDGQWHGHWTTDPAKMTCARCRKGFDAKI